MTAVSAEVRARRVAAAKKAAASRKRLLAVRAALDGGAPIEAPARGTARGDYSPAEILRRIREGAAG